MYIPLSCGGVGHIPIYSGRQPVNAEFSCFFFLHAFVALSYAVLASILRGKYTTTFRTMEVRGSTCVCLLVICILVTKENVNYRVTQVSSTDIRRCRLEFGTVFNVVKTTRRQPPLFTPHPLRPPLRPPLQVMINVSFQAQTRCSMLGEKALQLTCFTPKGPATYLLKVTIRYDTIR